MAFQRASKLNIYVSPSLSTMSSRAGSAPRMREASVWIALLRIGSGARTPDHRAPEAFEASEAGANRRLRQRVIGRNGRLDGEVRLVAIQGSASTASPA